MKKTFLYRSLICSLCLIALCITGCSTHYDSSALISKDATVVASIDFKSLTLKGELDNAEQYAFVKLLNSSLKEENTNLYEMVKSFMKDPSVSGVDFNDKVYLSYTDDYIMISSTTQNDATIENQIESLNEVYNAEIDILHKDNFEYCIFEETLIAWNEKHIAIIGTDEKYNADNMISFAENTFNLSASNNINSIKDYSNFNDQTNDINFFVSLGNIMELDVVKKALLEAGSSAKSITDINLQSSYIGTSIDFVKGAIVSNTISYMNNTDFQEQISNMVNKGINTKLLSFIPAENIMVLGGSLNMDKFTDYTIKSTEIEEDKLNAQIKPILDMSIRDLFGIFKGDFMLSLNDVNGLDNSALFTLTADLQNADNFTSILEKGMAMGGFTKEGDVYTMAISKNLFLYIQLNEELLLVTSDKNTIDSFDKGGLKNNLATTDKKSDIMNSYAYTYINLNTNTYPEASQSTLNLLSTMNEKLPMYLEIWNSFANNIVITSPSETETEMVLNTVEQQTNSLKSILNVMDENLMQLAH